RVLLDGRDREALGPLHAFVLRDAPGVARALHAPERVLELGRELALHHDEVAADVDDIDHLLTPHRADLDAGAASGACPDRLGRDGEVDQRPRALLARREGLAYQVELVALVDLERGRGERLARLVGRADVRAAVALDAGVGVEELRVTQVLQLRSTELLGGLVLQVDRLEHAEWHRLELLVTALEREVDRRREQVDVLGPREVRQEGEDETQGAPPTDMPTQHPAVAE